MSQEENKFVHDWDSIVIQLSKEEKVHGSIRMMKQDIDNMMFMQNMTRGEILEMLVGALETTEQPTPENPE